MKLELKHLACYLPYELKVYWHKESEPVWCEVGFDRIYHIIRYITDHPNKKRWKPILRPLSDLTKEVIINGERFIPIKKLFAYIDLNFDQVEYLVFDKILENIKVLKNETYELSTISERLEFLGISGFQELFKWHFDVFNLIDQDLAININTL